MSQSTSHAPDTTAHSLPVGTWVATIIGACAYAYAAFFVSAIVAWANQTTCNDPATPDVQTHGELGLLIVLAVAAAPWLVAVLVGGRARPAFLAGGLIAIAPVVFFLIAGIDRGFWSGSFCF